MTEQPAKPSKSDRPAKRETPEAPALPRSQSFDGLVRIDRLDGGVATLSLTRADKYNALSRQLMEAVAEAARSLREDTQTRALVICGEGKHFSSGADLSGGGLPHPSETLLRLRYRAGHEMATAVRGIGQITIAAVHGMAIGGAGVLALACDFRLAAQGARVGFPEIDLGMNMNWFSVPPLVRAVGESRAKRLYIGGQYEDADTLQQWGFFDEVHPPERLLPAALDMARFYATKPPIAAEMIKRSINAWAGQTDQAVMHADADQWVLAAMTDDFKQALRAFRDRKKG